MNHKVRNISLTRVVLINAQGLSIIFKQLFHQILFYETKISVSVLHMTFSLLNPLVALIVEPPTPESLPDLEPVSIPPSVFSLFR